MEVGEGRREELFALMGMEPLSREAGILSWRVISEEYIAVGVDGGMPFCIYEDREETRGS